MAAVALCLTSENMVTHLRCSAKYLGVG
jgi:hypothetical protein